MTLQQTFVNIEGALSDIYELFNYIDEDTLTEDVTIEQADVVMDSIELDLATSLIDLLVHHDCEIQNISVHEGILGHADIIGLEDSIGTDKFNWYKSLVKEAKESVGV